MEEFIPGRKGCNDRWDVVIGWIGVVSHHLGSLLGAIELTFLCAFVCKVGYFDASRGFDLLVSLGKCKYYYETTCIPRYFLYYENIVQISTYSF